MKIVARIIGLISVMSCWMVSVSAQEVANEVSTAPKDTVAVAISDSVVVEECSFIAEIDSMIDNQLPGYAHSVLFMPLVFEKQENIAIEKLDYDDNIVLDNSHAEDDGEYQLWLVKANRQANRLRAARNYTIVNCPRLVKYNLQTLPKAPREYVIVNDPARQTITIVEKPIEIDKTDIQPAPVKIKKWKTSFSSAIQLSQVYVSDNWYQGGTSSLNLLSDQLFTFNYIDPSGKLLFENMLQWKFNLTTSAEDTVHKVRVSEDLFQLNSKFGYKAFGKWYYSASLLFKTQLLTNYEPNSNVKQAEFFSPGELNLGIGMSYSHSYEKPVKLSHTLTLSPLSYNLRFVALPDIDPTRFGIESGHRTRNEFGSSLDYTLTWDLRYNIKWMSHLYAFTNYKTALIEWTNSLDFSFSSYFSARIYLDMRFDNSVPPSTKLGYLQLKELLSIGFSYKI